MTVQEFLTKWGFHVDHKPLEHLEKQIEGIKDRLEFLGAIEVVKGIYELTEKFSHFAEGLGTAATSAGLTVEELQKLQFAAGQSGVNAEEVSGAMAKLTRTLYEARNGSTEAKKSFQDAGFSDAQIAGFSTGKDALAALADQMQGMTDPIKKQAIAMQLLGRGSFNMVEFLSDGSKGMEELGEKAEKTGAVLSGKDVKALREVEDTLSGAMQTIRTFSAQIAAMFAPAVRIAVENMQRLYAANRQLIQSSVTEWAKKVVYSLGYVHGVIRSLMEIFFDFAGSHHGFAGTLSKILLGFIGLKAAAGVVEFLRGPFKILGVIFQGFWKVGRLVIEGFIKFGGVLVDLAVRILPMLQKAWAVFTAFMEANPLILTITAIAAALGVLVLAGEAAYTMLYKGGKFEDTWIGKIWKGIKGTGAWLAKALGVSLPNLPEDSPGYTPGNEFVGPMDAMQFPGKWDNIVSGTDRDRHSDWQVDKSALPAYQKRVAAMLTAAGQKLSFAQTNIPAPVEAGTGNASDPSARMVPPPAATTNVGKIEIHMTAAPGESAESQAARSAKAAKSVIQGAPAY